MKEIEIIKSSLIIEDYRKQVYSTSSIQRTMKYETTEQGTYYMIQTLYELYPPDTRIISESDYLKIKFE